MKFSNKESTNRYIDGYTVNDGLLGGAVYNGQNMIIDGYFYNQNLVQRLLSKKKQADTSYIADNELLKNPSGPWISDWEKEGKKNYDSSFKKETTSGVMYTAQDELFRYSNHKKYNKLTEYEDPTYLGFKLKIDDVMSPLFNYGEDLNIAKENSPLYFIKNYSIIPEIKNREAIYMEFIEKIKYIFDDTNSEKGLKKTYYINMVTGLDKLSNKMVKYGEDKLTIELTEDVSLLSSYIAELYNNLCYSYKNQHYLIPDNLLRFDLMIEFSDIRIFKNVEKNSNGSIQMENVSNMENGTMIGEDVQQINVNIDPPRMVYTLHDCNFIFEKALPFDQGMQIAGHNQGASSKAAVLTFDIIYKSISKEFKTSLVPGSKLIINKLDKILDNYDLSKINNYFSNNGIGFNSNYINDSKYQSVKLTKDRNSEQIALSTTTDQKKVKSKFDKFVNDIKTSATESINDYKDKLIDKFDGIRGNLINQTLGQIRDKTGIPKIYPDNVYKTDFRTLSIENFTKGLGSGLLNTSQDAATDALF